MADNRRKFVDVQQSQDSATAEEAIKRIAKLYAVEKLARGKSPKERAVLRQEHAKPIFDDLQAWLRINCQRYPANPAGTGNPLCPWPPAKNPAISGKRYPGDEQQLCRARHETGGNRQEELDIRWIGRRRQSHGHRLYPDRNRQTQWR